ncbi:MAG: flagellar motor switch protein FliN [Armatimonadota bacterium]
MPETIDGPDEMQTDVPESEEAAAAQHEPAEAAQDDDGGDGVVHQLQPDAIEAVLSSEAEGTEDWRNLHRMLDVPLSLTVELGSTEMPLSEVLRLEGGSVITINRMPGEPIDLLINGRVFARGEVVVINDTFGYRVTELVDGAEGTIEIGRDGG